ncbi:MULTISPECIES: hypothetical protein [Pelosinus]|uniref:hypothetical protein n=1 Tax=Pelosinus TaxID=365348 RepID=UPI0012F75BF0|nr:MULTISPECIES: hypothetical protein [Pelosinus]
MIVELFNDKSLKTPIFDKQQVERLISVDKCDYDQMELILQLSQVFGYLNMLRSRSSFAR